MDKVNFTKTLDSYRAPQHDFRILDVAPQQFLMVDGSGDPNTSPAYSAALEALYPVAYKLKFASARALGRDYVVPPLEGLWWADDMAWFTSRRDKTRWSWTMMLMLPDWLGVDDFDAARAIVGAKKPPARLDDVRLGSLAEATCVQTLHVGSFDDEAPVLEEMHERFIPGHDLAMSGRHHEVYFSDPRRVAPEKLRTLLRQPVAPHIESATP